jgi:hypothetical protein
MNLVSPSAFAYYRIYSDEPEYSTSVNVYSAAGAAAWDGNNVNLTSGGDISVFSGTAPYGYLGITYYSSIQECTMDNYENIGAFYSAWAVVDEDFIAWWAQQYSEDESQVLYWTGAHEMGHALV